MNGGAMTVTAPGPEASAKERLAWSREQMRQAMWARSHPQRRPTRGKQGELVGSPWSQRLKAIPGVGVVIEAVSDWWSKHPMAPIGAVAADAAHSVVLPLAQRHPIGLVAVAALGGAVLMKSRPRRWLFTRGLFAGLVPLLAVRLMDRLPIETWIGLLADFGNGPTATQAQTPRSPPKTPPGAQPEAQSGV